ncbi:reverse transcriptase domain-containing protein [Tanacetum coccineum]
MVQALIHTTRSLRTTFRKHKEKEVEGPVMKRFYRQGKQVLAVLDANEEETSELGAKLQAELTPTPRVWRLYLSRETIKEALLAGLVASAGKGMKDLHVFIDSQILVDQVEGSRVPATKQEKRYREEIMDAMTPFHKFRITHFPKILNTKAEMLTGLATIQLEFLNQEVSVGIKTRPTVEMENDKKEIKATCKMPMGKPNYNWKTSGRN